MKKLTYGMVGGGPGGFIGDAHRRAISLDESARVFGGTEACEFTKQINFSPSNIAFDDAIKNK